MKPEPSLGIIAGEGQFPFLVARGAKSSGRSVVAVGFKGHTRPEFQTEVEHLEWLNIGQLGKLIAFFSRHKVREVVFAGGINKPKALKLRPDFKAARLLFQLRDKSDNALLKAVVGMLTQEGFTIVGPTQIAPNLSTPRGVLTKRKPTQREKEDIAYGWPIAKEIGRMDIGQCIVVRNRMVVAVEAMDGSDATIARAGSLVGKGSVVIKVFKPGQEEHIDQPSVGLQTVRSMYKAGATCLAVEAEKSLFFDRAHTVHSADRSKICIVGCDSAEFSGTT